MKFKKFMNLTCFLLLTVLIVACVPVKIINPYFNTTYVKIKVMPDEAKKEILKGKVKSEVYIDDAYLPPRFSDKNSALCSYLKIPQGKHKVTIKAEGYRTWEKEIFFTGRYIVLRIDMEKENM
ncbi:MAG: hypothetical protein A2W05_11295 [Candidatus Schekmanbacteria bacterium RBG_16_38_10]|uniref:PEGA domain-containing protein n=1 Tax=Candidatus Schekmanbacteria bacterium RBG_16_38_10 TaxID=1817879 RepID=A0A1F7S0B7_9BACT|nr:MAG: hypothetical protein A2W05_11295 [Candidatus Schekmanbacteria bacterium RBG_16_38_10]